jgi:SAM-dependent methyltransferase
MSSDKAAKDTVRAQYAELAEKERCAACRLGDAVEKAKAIGYSEEELSRVPEDALATHGCGNPTALADLRPGETVLDLGSGTGLDAFLAAHRVGETGKVIGVDMTPEMVKKARENAAKAGYRNVRFRVGEIEGLPVQDGSVDVVISNCVINHSPDKVATFREALRVLKPGGRMLVSDLMVEPGIPEAVLQTVPKIWADWLVVALGKQDYLSAIEQAGFSAVTVVSERPFSTPDMHKGLTGKITSLQVRAFKPEA